MSEKKGDAATAKPLRITVNFELIFTHVAVAVLGFVCAYFLLLKIAIFNDAFYRFMFEQPREIYERFEDQQNIIDTQYHDILWNPPVSDQKGLVTYKPDRAYDGLTIYTTSEKQEALLIDMKGSIVHRWSLPFHEIEDIPESYRHIFKWGRTHLLPNGDLLIICGGMDMAALLKISKDSELVWQYKEPVHHDLDIDDEGRIFTLVQTMEPKIPDYLPLIDKPYFDDFLVILDAEGHEQKRISILEAFLDSPAERVLGQLIHDPTGGRLNAGDLLHTNSVEIIRKPEAGKAPMLVEGHILFSFRNNSLLAIMDPETGKMTWASYGPWHNQHDPRFMDDGSIILFDNEGNLGAGGASRVLRFDPETLEILWQYTGDDEHPLYSGFNSSVDALPNGNILVTESAAARLFEVTPDGEIVWDYRSATRVEEDGKTLVPGFFRGRRFAREDLNFLER